ncbi:hypothetical protein [Rhodobacter ferrooxidans]|uniref:Uncharacterized protein n=1 Tax=Rhodobacter ferrooxidans TaxID=371731 RepID=C8S5P1_9RHOB|nr:hypothetical protein [Rhodobacter sp. SW2]EEW23699.1 hypothetical protein Rsw2DRAFT_3370 [Rhodobacter sp. SW2]
MAVSQHAWVVEVLHDILQYAEEFDLNDLHDSCQLAYDAAVEEVGTPPCASKQVARQQRFTDAIRELIDYTEKENLTKTRLYLLLALTSAASHWDHPKLASTVIPFPVREEG